MWGDLGGGEKRGIEEEERRERRRKSAEKETEDLARRRVAGSATHSHRWARESWPKHYEGSRSFDMWVRAVGALVEQQRARVKQHRLLEKFEGKVLMFKRRK